MKKNKKYVIIGIDEAGRGPLAGPVAVAAVKAEVKNPKILKGIKDSKKLSVKQRLEWFKLIKSNFEYSVCMIGPQIIDRVGIKRAIRMATRRVLRKIADQRHREYCVLLDGLLFAPKHYRQQTIIKGDEKVPVISAASVVAKVLRDKKMLCFHKIYFEYGFESHKGYGTKHHYKMIKKHGVSLMHRKSYLTKLCFKRKK